MVGTEQTQAIDELAALAAVPGALKIITAEHACGAGTHEAAPGFDPAVCAQHALEDGTPVPTTDARHYVQHGVVRLEGPTEQGLMIAHSAEGDYCVGTPDALLRRLQEWRR